MNWTIRLYESARGEKLIHDFITHQDSLTQAKINNLITFLISYGPHVGMPYARYLGNKLYELRIRGRNEVRIFYTSMAGQQQIILLHAFNKRSQKLPVKELLIARKRQKSLTRL